MIKVILAVVVIAAFCFCAIIFIFAKFANKLSELGQAVYDEMDSPNVKINNSTPLIVYNDNLQVKFRMGSLYCCEFSYKNDKGTWEAIYDLNDNDRYHIYNKAKKDLEDYRKNIAAKRVAKIIDKIKNKGEEKWE